jgi:TatD DNase family protein
MMPNPEAYISAKEKAGDIVIGMTNLPSHFKMGFPHVKRYKHIRLALGLHPLLASDNKKELSLFNCLLDQTSYIGEIGLDFSKEGWSTKDDQVLLLRKLLAKLEGKKKIISVHSRKAENELFDLLCEYNIQNVIFHWYTGPIDLIPSIISKGYYFSINEAMTISNKGRAIIKVIPRNRILTESDAPFNNKTDIKEAQINMHITENEVKNNFMELLSRIK